MNTYNKIIGLFFAVSMLTFVGCSKDYLEKEPSENYLTSEQIKEIAKVDPNVTKALVNGLYNYMAEVHVGGLQTDEDFGQKGNDIISDILSCDMAYTNAYRRYEWIANLTDVENYRATVPHYMFWRYYYKIVAQANAVIAAYGGNDAVPNSNEKKWLFAQAKAMRAYAYVYLTMYFTTEYKPDEKVLVLYTEPASEAKAQVATKEIMDLAVKDLKQAISLMSSFSRENKSIVNQNVARGLLAYAYGYMGQYDKVVSVTSEIINSGEFTLTPKADLYNGMNNINNEKGWMWGVDIIPDMKLGLVSWWGQIDYFSYSYAAYGGFKQIDDVLYGKINDKDLRKKQFRGAPPHIPWYKFFAPERTPKGAKTTIEEDYVYMRVEEFYLLKAEAQAKLGQDASAIATLKPLLDQRYDSPADYAYITSMTGKALQDEIYLQTRIELWGEGKSYFAMKRNKAKVSRGSNHSHLPNTSYDYNDPRLTLKVPKDEVENNPNIKQ